MASVTFTGTKDMERKIRELDARMKQNLTNIVEAQAKQIAERAGIYCPRSEDGPTHLADTIEVQNGGVQQGRNTGGRFTSGTDAVAIITAGGSNYPHAVAVHENPSEHDPPTWKGKTINFRVGGSKFLERAMREGISDVKSAMRKVIK